MRIQDQDWEPVRNGQIIHRISPSTIGLVAKIHRVDKDVLTDQDWERIKLIAAAPRLLKACLAAEAVLTIISNFSVAFDDPYETTLRQLRTAIKDATP